MAEIRVLSLGAGVQSTTIALMAAHGEIEPPDVAIFADTQWEPAATYEHLRWLMSIEMDLPFPINIVTAGDIRENIRTRRNTTGGSYAAIPWFMRAPNGAKSVGRRQCTREYKLEPISREVRRLLGKPWPARVPRGAAEMLIGISLDEIYRVKESRIQFMTNTYPLIDRGMRRWDCLRWLEKQGYPKPPKSACIGCPYTNNERWRDRRDNHPEEWADAVRADRELRKVRTGKTEYMHRQMIPLDQVDLEDDDTQLDLFQNECEGMCGV